LLLTPFIKPFSSLIFKLIHDDSPSITQLLDNSLVSMPGISIESARLTTLEIFREMIKILGHILQESDHFTKVKLVQKINFLKEAEEETRTYLSKIQTRRGTKKDKYKHISILHALDHLNSIITDLKEYSLLKKFTRDKVLSAIIEEIKSYQLTVLEAFELKKTEKLTESLELFSKKLAVTRKETRLYILQKTADGDMSPEIAQSHIEVVKWSDALWFHIWRAFYHLGEKDESIRLIH
jgi:phosphate:Na+ symporter